MCDPIATGGLVFHSTALMLTYHFGAFDGGRLVGVATFFPEKCPVEPGPRAWCLRGMATLPDLQRRGAGRALVAEGVGAAEAAGAELMWCKARTSARGFYESLGFVAVDEAISCFRGLDDAVRAAIGQPLTM